MSIKLQSIYQSMNHMYHCRLVAAKSGLDNIVSWIHFIEDTSTISDFLRPGELVVTTGICYTGAPWLYDLIGTLHRYGACGLVVNVGEYIAEIPKEIIGYCETIHFPIFTFPWEIHVVDVIQSCSAQILNANQADDTVATAFQNFIFSPGSAPLYFPILKKYHYEPDDEYQVIVVGNGEPSKFNVEMEFAIRNLACHFFPSYNAFFRENQLIIVLKQPEKTVCQEMADRIVSFFQHSCKTFLNVGVGTAVPGVTLLSASYKKALAALHFSSNNRISPAFYDSMGLNRLFYSLDDFTAVSEICKSQLGALEEYDQRHHTDYIHTFRLYLKYNESVQKVADATFTHRNTVNYRIAKIKKILGCGFETMEERFPYEVAFYCRDIIGKG